MKKLFIALSLFTTLLVPAGVAAQSVDIFEDVCKREPSASACEDRVGNSKDPNQNPIYGPNGIVTKAVNILSLVIGIAAVIFIIVAGFRFIISGSNSQNVNESREHVIYALVALVLAAVAQIMVRFVLTKIE